MKISAVKRLSQRPLFEQNDLQLTRPQRITRYRITRGSDPRGLTESNRYAFGLRVNYHSSNIAVIGDSPNSLDLSFRRFSSKARDYTALSRLAVAPLLRDNHGECVL
jgi:hypothetical protein